MTNLPERPATAAQRDDLLRAARFAVKYLTRDPNWETHLDDIVERIGRTADASRCHIFEKRLVETGGFELRCRAKWEAPDVHARQVPAGAESILVSNGASTEWESRLVRGEPLLNFRDEMPDPVRNAIAAGNITAYMAVPVSIDGDWWGCLCLEDCRSERDWESAELDTLILVADALGAAVERQRVERARARLSSIVENSDDAIVFKDLDGLVTGWNTGAERLYGYSAAEIVGGPVKLLFPRDRIFESSLIMERLRRGERVDHYETRRVRKDGSEIDVSVGISPIYDCSGVVVGAVSISRDITRRRQAEIALRASEERLRIAIEAGDAGTWDWFIEAGEVTWSSTMELLHGLEPGSFGGTMDDFLSLVHPDDRERVRTQIRKALSRGSCHAEFRTRFPDDTERWLELRGQVVRDDQRRPVRMTGICYETTERRKALQAQTELRERAERASNALDAERTRLYELFQHAPAMMALLHGPDHTFTMTNDHFLTMVGFRDVIGKPLLEAIPEVKDSGIVELLDHVYQTGETITRVEWPIQVAVESGELTDVRYVSFAYQPIRQADGTVTGVVIHAVDMTEHVTARQRIEELAVGVASERDRLQQIIDVMPEGIVITDERGAFVLTNSAAHRIWGHASPERVYTDSAAIESYMPDGSPLPTHVRPLHRSLFDGETVLGEQVLVRREQSQELVPVLVNSAPLRDSSGDVRGAVVMFQDISEIKEFERQKDEFLQTVSHDLKNPLTSIQGYAQILRRIPSDDRERAAMAIGHMESAAKRAIGLLDEILDLTRFQMGRPLELTRTRADMVQFLSRLVEQHQATTERHHVRMEPHVTELFGEWDVVRLERVLGNLLSNAILYSPAGGEITVTVDREGSGTGEVAVIRVRDQGIGIPPADLPYVFERFRRGSNVQDSIRGTGLGLAGAKAIVDAHGGEISVESVEGEGSTFTVRLPLTVQTSELGG